MAASPKTTVHTISASTVGRYVVAPAAEGDTAPLLVGFHGYGQSAVEHLEALRGIPGVDRWRLASIQALHRFYQDPHRPGGRVLDDEPGPRAGDPR